MLPRKEDIAGQIRIVCNHSPKIRAILALVAEVTIKNKQKQVIWLKFPAQQLLLWDILHKMGVNVGIYSSDVPQRERNELLDNFNQHPDRPMVLLCGENMAAFGLNMQKKCHNNILGDCPMSRQTRESLDGRLRRVGQENDVLSYDISMRRTFNERQLQNNLGKAIPGLMSELNQSIFDIGQDDQAGDLSYTVGDWVIVKGVLMPATDPRAAHVGYDRYLPAIDVLQKMLQDERGEYVSIDMTHGRSAARDLEEADSDTDSGSNNDIE